MTESIIIFHSCSTNINLKTNKTGYCNERHIGNTPRSVMTKGTSTRRKKSQNGEKKYKKRLPMPLYGNLDPGNNDKLMISYKRDFSHDYTMKGACGVIYQGDMHLFGGESYNRGTFLPQEMRGNKRKGPSFKSGRGSRNGGKPLTRYTNNNRQHGYLSSGWHPPFETEVIRKYTGGIKMHIDGMPRRMSTKSTKISLSSIDIKRFLRAREEYYDANLIYGEDYGVEHVTFRRQHFVIETQRSGQIPKITKKEDLNVGFTNPSCSSFGVSSEIMPWFTTNFVIICFDKKRSKSCYSFDGELTKIGDSNAGHWFGGLANYKNHLVTVGGLGNKITEIMERKRNGAYTWSVVEQDFEFNKKEELSHHSLVSIPSSQTCEEYVLLIGGTGGTDAQNNVFKSNGTWFNFGTLNKPRSDHNSIYWNGAVYVIGGRHKANKKRTKIEIWDIANSPGVFNSSENWPDLLDWANPHLFIVSDSFFPDQKRN